MWHDDTTEYYLFECLMAVHQLLGIQRNITTCIKSRDLEGTTKAEGSKAYFKIFVK